MIFEWIVSSLIAVSIGVLQTFFPVSDPPITAIGGILHAYSWFNTWLPLYECLDAMRTVVEVTLVIAGLNGIIWALRRLPFGVGGT